MILEESFGKSTDFTPGGTNAFEYDAKRIGDCSLAFVTLVVPPPLLLIYYTVVRYEDGGPAVPGQERISRFGRPLNIYRFHSMRLDTERFDPTLYKGGADSCMTHVDKFLCEHYLNELPQLRNILIGGMSLASPRPERRFYVGQIMGRDLRYHFLYQICPGVTSYATLYNGYADTLEKMLRHPCHDLSHLEYRSWWLDFKILVKTFLNVAFGRKF